MIDITRERPSSVRIIVISNSQALVDSIVLILAGKFPLEIVGTTLSGTHWRTLVKDTRPHIVLIAEDGQGRQFDLPPLQISREINLSQPGVATILATTLVDNDHLRQVFAAGARGVVEITRTPQGCELSGEELETAIRQAYEYVRQFLAVISARTSADGSGQMITFFSPKGGVGKSTIVANLAATLAMQRPQMTVAVVDLNLQFGMLNVLLDIKPKRTMFDLVAVADELNTISIQDFLTTRLLTGENRLYVLPAPLDPRQSTVLTGRHISSILTVLRRTYQVVLVDTTATISDVTLTALQNSTDIVLVATPDVLAIHQTRAALNVLTDPQFNLRNQRKWLVLNRASERTEVKPGDIENLFRDELPLVGGFPADFAFLEFYINTGLLPAQSDRRHAYLDELRFLAGRLVPMQPVVNPKQMAEQRPKSGFFNRVLSRSSDA